MKLIDSHTHLYSKEFDADRNEVIQRAIDAGVSKFFIPAIDSTHTQSMYDLEKDNPDTVFLMMGLHPTSVKDNYETELQHIEEELSKRNFCAIGEIGIDLHWDKTTLSIQIDAFRRQIRLAKKYQLPIIIHCREAFDEVFSVLEEEKSDDLFGIFHCFTGTYEQAKKIISLKMKLGIGGVITFKGNKIETFLNKINIKNIVLETDSPYLAPAPHRGKRNESSYLRHIVSKLSQLYSMPEIEIGHITTENSKTIFENNKKT